MGSNHTNAAAAVAPPMAQKTPWLQSIKTRIMVFALAATTIPAITLGSLSYLQNTRFLTDKISQELRDATAQIAREIDLLVKEKLYDVRVFASSYIVSENLVSILSTEGAEVEDRVALGRIQEYLQSVRAKFSDYGELILVDLEGRLIATSASERAPPTMPGDWRNTIESGQPVIGAAVFDRALNARVLLVADPIRTPKGKIIGVLGAKLTLATVDDVLDAYSQAGLREAYLINHQGKVLASSQAVATTERDLYLDHASVTKLYDHMGEAVTYSGPDGQTVIGTLKRVPALGWGVVAEMNREKAFAQIKALQHMTLGLVACLLVGIGLSAYVLGLTIVRPLRRLGLGADQVAAGNLDIDLPVNSRSEVGYLTRVFNHMVARLRRSRDELASVNDELQTKNRELEQLSITDELTGLHNRKHLMETLKGEAVRSRRNGHAFALLVIDIDHFKQINDTYGHQKGDDVLRRLGEQLREAVRSCDYVARYGGEEFIVMLPEVGVAGGLEVAERIRERVARERINPKGEAITVSIGMAVFDEHGDNADLLFQRADQALYKAKASGRNRIATADDADASRNEKNPIRLVPKDKRQTSS